MVLRPCLYTTWVVYIHFNKYVGLATPRICSNNVQIAMYVACLLSGNRT